MDLENPVIEIYNILAQFTPLFRMIWFASILIGIAMVIIAFALKKNPQRKNSPWIVGGIGLVMIISSGTQLLFSLV